MTSIPSSEKITVSDIILECDLLSRQKWQPRTGLQHPSSHSCRVHLDDGQVWRQHMDEVLQNNPGSKLDKSGVPSLETATTVDPDPKPVISPEPSSHPPDDSARLETAPTSISPMLC